MCERDLRDEPAAIGERREIRAVRDQAIRALYGAELSSDQISRLRLFDVRTFPSGKVTVRLRGPRWPGHPRYVVLDGRPANQVARHLEARATADRTHYVFAGRVVGSSITRRHVSRVLRAPQDPIERRERP